MKIAITGGTSSVGKSLVKAYESRGHEVINISRSLGYNFEDKDSIIATIESCDVFVNCLYLKDLQIELLDALWEKWKDTSKEIINISTCNTLPGFQSKDQEYHRQKIMLECKHWLYVGMNTLSPRMYLVKFGDGDDNATWDAAGEYVVNAIETSKQNVKLFELSVFK